MSFVSRFQGLTAITVLAIGQLVSLIGTGMTTFALTIWVWSETGRATDIGLMAACGFGPLFLLTPLAGALVDRWDRKLVMVLSDSAAVFGAALYLVLFLQDRLEVGHLFLITAFSGAFRAFQLPAFSASVSVMVEKKHYVRASGMLSMPNSSALIIAPVLAGALHGKIGLAGILILDLVTFLVAILSLSTVRVPPPPRSQAGSDAPSGIGAEMLFGWSYIQSRKPLLGILSTVFAFNFVLMTLITLLSPIILARTANDEIVLGTVQSLLGLGGLSGALLLSVWGGPQRRVEGVLKSIVATSVLLGLAIGFSTTVWVWYLSAFLGSVALPIMTGCTQAIWQAKIPPDIQGRVFAIRRLLSQISSLPAFLLAGVLADRVFEPALTSPPSTLARLFGPLVGHQPGAGLSVIFILTGILGIAVGVGGYFFRSVRQVDELLPDHGFFEEAPIASRTSDDVLGAEVALPPPAPDADQDEALSSHWRSTS